MISCWQQKGIKHIPLPGWVLPRGRRAAEMGRFSVPSPPQVLVWVGGDQDLPGEPPGHPPNCPVGRCWQLPPRPGTRDHRSYRQFSVHATVSRIKAKFN